jgi:hypothetical protein
LLRFGWAREEEKRIPVTPDTYLFNKPNPNADIRPPPPPVMRTLALVKPLLRLGLLAGLACLAHAVFADSYAPPTPPTPPATPPTTPRHRYPVGYDPDNRQRPRAYPAEHILLPKPLYPPPSTRGEAKAGRWQPPEGYVPRRRSGAPALRRTDTREHLAPPPVDPPPPAADDSACPMRGCKLDASKHLCTGIWMGCAIIDRVCLKLAD